MSRCKLSYVSGEESTIITSLSWVSEQGLSLFGTCISQCISVCVRLILFDSAVYLKSFVVGSRSRCLLFVFETVNVCECSPTVLSTADEFDCVKNWDTVEIVCIFLLEKRVILCGSFLFIPRGEERLDSLKSSSLSQGDSELLLTHTRVRFEHANMESTCLKREEIWLTVAWCSHTDLPSSFASLSCFFSELFSKTTPFSLLDLLNFDFTIFLFLEFDPALMQVVEPIQRFTESGIVGAWTVSVSFVSWFNRDLKQDISALEDISTPPGPRALAGTMGVTFFGFTTCTNVYNSLYELWSE